MKIYNPAYTTEDFLLGFTNSPLITDVQALLDLPNNNKNLPDSSFAFLNNVMKKLNSYQLNMYNYYSDKAHTISHIHRCLGKDGLYNLSSGPCG